MKLFLSLSISALASVVPLPADAVPAQSGPSASPSTPHSPTNASTTHTMIVPLNRPQISQKEWQELSHASAEAMKAHPELKAKAQALAQRMRDFQSKLDAAMLQDNPELAPFISRLENRGAAPGGMAPHSLPPGISTSNQAPEPSPASK